MKYYISSPNKGGLQLFENNNLSQIKNGNFRGLTYKEETLYFVNGDKIYNFHTQVFNDLPNRLWHDIKYCDKKKCFYLISSETQELLEISPTGKIKKQIKFNSSFWPNCCLPIFDTQLIVFLSVKRPYSKSKIICLNEKLEILWEYLCFENDEIHSPFLFQEHLYWCRSNKNCVVKASLDSKLRDAKKIIINNFGYTRGLHISENYIVLGTSENRHSENSCCQSIVDHGCVHFYNTDNFNLQKTIHLSYKEVYDILC